MHVVRVETYNFTLPSQNCLITGANTGVGFGVATELVKHGANVIIAGRSALKETILKLEKVNARYYKTSKIESIYADLSDYKSILCMLEKLLTRFDTNNIDNEAYDKLDILILNAGLTIYPPKQIQINSNASEKLDLMTMVNCVSNYIIVRYVCMKNGLYFFNNINHSRNDSRSQSLPRIVYVSSESHRTLKDYKKHAFVNVSNYSLLNQVIHYRETKLWNQMFANYFVEKCRDKIDIHMTCPGGVATAIAKHAHPSVKYLANIVMNIWFQSCERGAKHILYSCMKPRQLLKSGTYHWMMYKRDPTPTSLDKDNIAHLMKNVDKVLKLFEKEYGRLDLQQREIVHN